MGARKKRRGRGAGGVAVGDRERGRVDRAASRSLQVGSAALRQACSPWPTDIGDENRVQTVAIPWTIDKRQLLVVEESAGLWHT